MTLCPLCKRPRGLHYAQARDIEYVTSDRTFDFYRCQDCDVLFISPMLSDKLNEIYPKNYYSFSNTKRSSAAMVKEWLDRRAFRAQLKEIAGDRLAVLDVGGGTGWLLDIIKACDARVTETSVVDLDADAGDRARAAGHTYWHGPFETFPGGKTFNLITMLNLIEHVADPRAVLQKARDLLAPGGQVLIQTPNFLSLDARLFKDRSWAGYHTPRHFVIFQRSSLEQLCRDCGLSVASFAYTQGAPFWSVSLLEELRRLGLVSITAERPAINHPLTPLLQIASAGFDFARSPFAKLSQMKLVLQRAD